MENPIQIDDLGGPTPIFGNTHIFTVHFPASHGGLPEYILLNPDSQMV